MTLYYHGQSISDKTGKREGRIKYGKNNKGIENMLWNKEREYYNKDVIGSLVMPVITSYGNSYNVTT